MVKRLIRPFLALTIAAMGGVSLPALQLLWTAPAGIRKIATAAPLPAYPASTLRAGRSGIVAVQVTISAAGRIVESKFLEVLDEATTASVGAALHQWRFKTLREEGIREEWPRQGKLLFQFTVRDGQPVVTDLAAGELARLRKEEDGNR